VERNGDLVKMGAMLSSVHVNLRDWAVNLIEYDSSRSFATLILRSELFNDNKPDVNLDINTQLLSAEDPNKPLMAGKFGLVHGGQERIQGIENL